MIKKCFQFSVKCNRKSLRNNLLLILPSPPPYSSPLKGEETRKELSFPHMGRNVRKVNFYIPLANLYTSSNLTILALL